MTLKAGTTNDFSDSMAAAIEAALKTEWPNVMGAGSTVDSNPQLRLLCIAVAQGVLRHLKDNPADIKVLVNLVANATTAEGAVKEINVDGTLY